MRPRATIERELAEANDALRTVYAQQNLLFDRRAQVLDDINRLRRELSECVGAPVDAARKEG